MPTQVLSSGGSSPEKKLPVVTFNCFVFPFVQFEIGPPFTEGFKEAIEHALNGRNGCECLAMFKDPRDNMPSKFAGLLDVGVVLSIERSGDDIVITGAYRANVLTFERDKKIKKLGWATIEPRPDIPLQEEVEHNLEHVELPMLLGCVETILRLLKEINRKVIPNDEESKYFKEKLEKQILNLQNERREPYTPYQICWYVPGTTFDCISDRYKVKMLLEDRAVDRLQLVIEALQLEKKILTLQNGLQSDMVEDMNIGVDPDNSKGK